MKQLKTLRKEAEERKQLAKQFLQQQDGMIRMQLSPVEWLCFKLGCSALEAETLIAELAAAQS